MSTPIPTSSVAAKFAQIIESLRVIVPKFIAKDRNAGPLIILIWSHLGRLGREFAALAARAEAGTLRAASRRRPVAPGVGTRCTGTAPVPSGVPTKFAWLGDMMWETRIFGGYLNQMVLNDPEMAALIAACPPAGRIVRSILWMTSQSPVPAILRVSRRKRVRASPRPLREGPGEGLSRSEVTGSCSVDESTPPSVPPTRGGMKKDSIPLTKEAGTSRWPRPGWPKWRGKKHPAGP